MSRHYELVVRPAENGGWWLCDDEGNRDWFPTQGAAIRAARRLGREPMVL